MRILKSRRDRFHGRVRQHYHIGTKVIKNPVFAQPSDIESWLRKMDKSGRFIADEKIKDYAIRKISAAMSKDIDTFNKVSPTLKKIEIISDEEWDRRWKEKGKLGSEKGGSYSAGGGRMIKIPERTLKYDHWVDKKGYNIGLKEVLAHEGKGHHMQDLQGLTAERPGENELQTKIREGILEEDAEDAARETKIFKESLKREVGEK